MFFYFCSILKPSYDFFPANNFLLLRLNHTWYSRNTTINNYRTWFDPISLETKKIISNCQ